MDKTIPNPCQTAIGNNPESSLVHKKPDGTAIEPYYFHPIKFIEHLRWLQTKNFDFIADVSQSNISINFKTTGTKADLPKGKKVSRPMMQIYSHGELNAVVNGKKFPLVEKIQDILPVSEESDFNWEMAQKQIAGYIF